MKILTINNELLRMDYHTQKNLPYEEYWRASRPFDNLDHFSYGEVPE